MNRSVKVIENLIEKTKSGELKWDKSQEGYFIYAKSGEFICLRENYEEYPLCTERAIVFKIKSKDEEVFNEHFLCSSIDNDNVLALIIALCDEIKNYFTILYENKRNQLLSEIRI